MFNVQLESSYKLTKIVSSPLALPIHHIPTLSKKIKLPFVPFLGLTLEVDGFHFRVDEVHYSNSMEQFSCIMNVEDMEYPEFRDRARDLKCKGWTATKLEEVDEAFRGD